MDGTTADGWTAVGSWTFEGGSAAGLPVEEPFTTIDIRTSPSSVVLCRNAILTGGVESSVAFLVVARVVRPLWSSVVARRAPMLTRGAKPPVAFFALAFILAIECGEMKSGSERLQSLSKIMEAPKTSEVKLVLMFVKGLSAAELVYSVPCYYPMACPRPYTVLCHQFRCLSISCAYLYKYNSRN